MAELGTDSLLKAQSADPVVAAGSDSKSLLEQFREIEAEHGKDAPAEAEAEETEVPAKVKVERGDDGKFKKAEAEKEEKPERKGVEGKPEVRERIALRQEKRELHAKIAAREAEIEAKAQELQGLIDDLEKGAQKNVRALAESGDMDGVAAALGFKDWNDMNSQYARRLASPEYRHTKAVEAKLAKIESERDEQRRQQAAQHEQTEQQRQVAEAMSELQTSLKEHTDPIVSALAEDDDFGVAVFNFMDHAYRTTGEMPDIDEAAGAIVDGARSKFTRWTAVFGGQPTSQAEARSRVTPDRAGSKTPERKASKHVSTNTATEASEPLPKNLTDAQWKELALKEMREAMRVDAETGAR